MKIINKKNASLFLTVNTMLWGSAYVWSKMVIKFLPPIFALLLCESGGLIFSIIVFHKSIRNITLKTIKLSFGINIFYILSNLFYMFALKYTTSSNVSFIMQLTVVMVPIIVVTVNRTRPEKRVIIGSAAALIGIILSAFRRHFLP